jgi:hypothetical protein
MIGDLMRMVTITVTIVKLAARVMRARVTCRDPAGAVPRDRS